MYEARNAEEAIEWSLDSGVKPQPAGHRRGHARPERTEPRRAAAAAEPGLRVLYMSGYTDDATAVHGTFCGGVPLLQKPFTPSKLADRIRSILDTKDDVSPTNR